MHCLLIVLAATQFVRIFIFVFFFCFSSILSLSLALVCVWFGVSKSYFDSKPTVRREDFDVFFGKLKYYYYYGISSHFVCCLLLHSPCAFFRLHFIFVSATGCFWLLPMWNAITFPFFRMKLHWLWQWQACAFRFSRHFTQPNSCAYRKSFWYRGCYFSFFLSMWCLFVFSLFQRECVWIKDVVWLVAESKRALAISIFWQHVVKPVRKNNFVLFSMEEASVVETSKFTQFGLAKSHISD